MVGTSSLGFFSDGEECVSGGSVYMESALFFFLVESLCEDIMSLQYYLQNPFSTLLENDDFLIG